MLTSPRDARSLEGKGHPGPSHVRFDTAVTRDGAAVLGREPSEPAMGRPRWYAHRFNRVGPYHVTATVGAALPRSVRLRLTAAIAPRLRSLFTTEWQARASGAPVVPAFCLLDRARRYVISLGDPIEVEAGGEDAALRHWVTLLEEMVRSHPAQWFNFFDCWSMSSAR